MGFEDWVRVVPSVLTAEIVWRVQAFRLGCYLGYCAVEDQRSLEGVASLDDTCRQLVRATGSVAANVAEGYSRRSRKDRIRYYEYALGSANEAKGWYMAMRDRLGRGRTDLRLDYLAQVSRLLLAMIQNERSAAAQGTSRSIPRP